jgi:hypothetical protein
VASDLIGRHDRRHKTDESLLTESISVCREEGLGDVPFDAALAVTLFVLIAELLIVIGLRGPGSGSDLQLPPSLYPARDAACKLRSGAEGADMPPSESLFRSDRFTGNNDGLQTVDRQDGSGS